MIDTKKYRQCVDDLCAEVERLESANGELAQRLTLEQSNHISELTRLREQCDTQRRELSTLESFSGELKLSLEASRINVNRLETEKAGLESKVADLKIDLEQLKNMSISQRLGLGKLAEFIRRRHRPDNLPERLNAIDHTNFRR